MHKLEERRALLSLSTTCKSLWIFVHTKVNFCFVWKSRRKVVGFVAALNSVFHGPAAACRQYKILVYTRIGNLKITRANLGRCEWVLLPVLLYISTERRQCDMTLEGPKKVLLLTYMQLTMVCTGVLRWRLKKATTPVHFHANTTQEEPEEERERPRALSSERKWEK